MDVQHFARELEASVYNRRPSFHCFEQRGNLKSSPNSSKPNEILTCLQLHPRRKRNATIASKKSLGLPRSALLAGGHQQVFADILIAINIRLLNMNMSNSPGTMSKPLMTIASLTVNRITADGMELIFANLAGVVWELVMEAMMLGFCWLSLDHSLNPKLFNMTLRFYDVVTEEFPVQLCHLVWLCSLIAKMPSLSII